MRLVRSAVWWFTGVARRTLFTVALGFTGFLALTAAILPASALPVPLSLLGLFAYGAFFGIAALVLNVGSNLAADWINTRVEKRLPDVSSFFRNHHLAIATGKALAMVLREAAASAKADRDIKEPRGLPEYWADYQPDAAVSEPRPDTLAGYAALARVQRTATGSSSEAVSIRASGSRRVDLTASIQGIASTIAPVSTAFWKRSLMATS